MKPRRDTGDKARREAAETLAVAALSFLAADQEQLGHFLATTGIGPERIRIAARDPSFLAGVLDYFAADESLLVAFAREAGISPGEVDRARIALSGLWERDTP